MSVRVRLQEEEKRLLSPSFLLVPPDECGILPALVVVFSCLCLFLWAGSVCLCLAGGGGGTLPDGPPEPALSAMLTVLANRLQVLRRASG